MTNFRNNKFNNKHQKNKPKPHNQSNTQNHKRDVIKDNQVWIYGKHPFYSVLKNAKRKIFEIFVSINNRAEFEKFISNNSQLKDFANITKYVSNEEINILVSSRNGDIAIHQGYLILASKLPNFSQNDLLTKLEAIKDSGKNLPKLLILDQISDPHNVGAIIRSAVAFGVNKIIFCHHNSPKENATMIKTSVGTIEDCEITVVINISALLEKLKEIGYWCVGLSGEGTATIDEIKKFDNIALIIGSEGDGIRPLIKKNCDLIAKINIDNKVESLNASVACAITLYELSK